MADEHASMLHRLLAEFNCLDDVEKTDFLRGCIKQCKPAQLQMMYAEIERRLAKDFIDFFPRELIERIFSYLDVRTLCRVACVNNKWRQMSNSDQLWHDLCRRKKWESYSTNKALNSMPEQSIRRPSSAPRKATYRPYEFSSKEQSKRLTGRICRWKDLYIRVFHLEKNWAYGLYSVKPVLRGHTQPVTCMDCNGDIIASGSSDSTVRLWDMSTFECKAIFADFQDSVKCIRLKGNVLVTGCSDSVIRIFDTNAHVLVRELHGHEGSVDHICFDGKYIASASSSDRKIRIWSLNDGRCLHCLEGHTDDIEILHLRNGILVSASWDESVRLWNIETGILLHSLLGHTEVVMCCQLDDEKIVTGGADGNIMIWDLKLGHLKQTLFGHDEVYCLQFNENIIASGSADSTVRIWSYSGVLLYSLEEHIGIVRCIHLHKTRLISGGDCKKIVIWDAEKGELLNVVHRHPTSLHLMWTDETRIVTASPETPGTVTVLSYWS